MEGANPVLFAPQLCGGFYARSRRTGPAAEISFPTRAAAMIERDLARQRTPNHLAAAAALQLLRHRARASISLLDEALAAAPGEARIWSDLAAAHLTEAESTGAASDLVQALSAADHALRLQSYLAEARFNLALTLERLFLLGEARAAWCEAVASAPTAELKGELRRRCRQVVVASTLEAQPKLEKAAVQGDVAAVRRAVTADPQAAREWVIDDLLPLWGEAARVAASPSRTTAAGYETLVPDQDKWVAASDCLQ
jgi:hypothetical protein